MVSATISIARIISVLRSIELILPNALSESFRQHYLARQRLTVREAASLCMREAALLLLRLLITKEGIVTQIY